jgi:AraC-like DNA-binding protein
MRLGDANASVALAPIIRAGHRDHISSIAPVDAPISVAVLIRGVAERTRFAGALRQHLHATFSSDASDIVDRLTRGGIDAVVIGLHDERGVELAPVAQSIARRFPALTILFYLSLEGEDVREALSLASSVRPHAVIIRGIDDVSLVITQAVIGMRQTGATRDIVGMVGRIAPLGLKDTLVFMARNAIRPLHVADVARYAGVSRRTLFNRFHQSGLPTVSRVIHWLRLLYAAAGLDAPDVTVEQIADELRFPSSSTLRHLLKRLTSLTATDIRKAGGFPYLLKCAEQVLTNDAVPLRPRVEPRAPIALSRIARAREVAR